jgi:hypothetical protein
VEVETPLSLTREARAIAVPGGSIGDRSLFRSNPGDAYVETIFTDYDDVKSLGWCHNSIVEATPNPAQKPKQLLFQVIFFSCTLKMKPEVYFEMFSCTKLQQQCLMSAVFVCVT